MRRASVRSALAAAVVGLMLASIGPVAAAQKPQPKGTTHKVTIDGATFKPDTIDVKVGDSIVWTNKDPYPHTVTSKSGGFDSKDIDPDASWTYVARKAGEFPYICTLHTTMKGTLRVK
jgi:plastocyanin